MSGRLSAGSRWTLTKIDCGKVAARKGMRRALPRIRVEDADGSLLARRRRPRGGVSRSSARTRSASSGDEVGTGEPLAVPAALGGAERGHRPRGRARRRAAIAVRSGEAASMSRTSPDPEHGGATTKTGRSMPPRLLLLRPFQRGPESAACGRRAVLLVLRARQRQGVGRVRAAARSPRALRLAPEVAMRLVAATVLGGGGLGLRSDRVPDQPAGCGHGDLQDQTHEDHRCESLVHVPMPV